MEKLKIALLVLVAALLVLFLIDRSREPEQMRALKQSIDNLNGTLQRPQRNDDVERLAREVAELKDRLAQGATVAPVGGAPTSAKDPARDGNPKLGVNFLLPYDRSHFRPELVRGTIRNFNTTPKGLNPLTDNSAITQGVWTLCNDSLCDRPPATPELWTQALAESVVISDDYKTYTFTIRRGVRWHIPLIAQQPGFAWLRKEVELTSADFAFVLDLILDPTVDCPSLRTYYEDIDSYETPDPYTLVVRWKKKVYTSLSFTMGLSPLPRHIFGADRDGTVVERDKRGVLFNKHWFSEANGVCGVGAYMLSEYKPDETMRFRRNGDYWGVTQHFDAIDWRLDIKKDDAQLIAFKNAQVHSYGLTPLKYKSEILDHNEPRFAAVDPADPKAGRKGELGWERVKAMSFQYIGWNMRAPPFDDRLVRQAMSHAFPKERIIRDVFFGLGIPVLSDVHPDSQYCNRDLKPYAFDLERAKALLAQAGWSDGDGDGMLDKMIGDKRVPLSFEIKYYANSPEWDNTLAIFRNELRRIGVDAKPKTYEFKELMRIYEDKDFAAVVGGWSMDWDIDYFQLWHSSQVGLQGSSNHCGFADPRVDELAVHLRATFDTAERIAIAKEIQAIIHQEQPYTFFRSVEGIFVWQNRPQDGQPVPPERYLDGVIKGLDELHPLANRARLFWHFRQ